MNHTRLYSFLTHKTDKEGFRDIMPLSWSNQTDIAAALLGAYPDIDRLALNHDSLLKLIHSLPAFNDAPTPPAANYLDHILWTWMRLDHGDTDEQGRCCQ